MEVRFCGQCGKPLDEYGKVEVKPTWRLAWGLEWRRWLLILTLCIPIAWLLYIFWMVSGMVSG